MPSEYDPIRRSIEDPLSEDDLEQVRELFERSSRPYLSGPWSWLCWAVILPAAALATPYVLGDLGGVGVLFLWSIAVLVGGAVEAVQIFRTPRKGSPSTLARWVLRAQGNLSLVGLFLSLALILQGEAWLLPGVWLLLLGHSLFSLGGLAFRPLRVSGLLYQIGGLLAIWPHGFSLPIFAAATFLANLVVAIAIWRR